MCVFRYRKMTWTNTHLNVTKAEMSPNTPEDSSSVATLIVPYLIRM